MENEFQEFAAIIREFCEERDWYQYLHPRDVAVALQLEASEVLAHFRFSRAADPQEVAMELADVLYYVILLSDILHINLAQSFHTKMEQNRKKYPVEKFFGKNLKYDEVS